MLATQLMLFCSLCGSCSVADAMKEAEAYDATAAAAPPPAPVDPETAEGAEEAEVAPAPVVPPLVVLGREAAEKLRTGQDVPDELVVAVLVIAMQVRVGLHPFAS